MSRLINKSYHNKYLPLRPGDLEANIANVPWGDETREGVGHGVSWICLSQKETDLMMAIVDDKFRSQPCQRSVFKVEEAPVFYSSPSLPALDAGVCK